MKTLLFLLSLGLVHPAFGFPLAKIETQIQELKHQGRTPVAIFDLDETLVYSRVRRIESYLDALAPESPLSKKWGAVTQVVLDHISTDGIEVLSQQVNGYNSFEFFNSLYIPGGIVTENFITDAENEMLKIYLTGKYIKLDQAIPGSRKLLNLIYQAGGRVYFVSSRYDSTHTETLANLKALHLYQNKKQSQIMLRKAGERSIDFKVRAFQTIQRGLAPHEKVALVAENEPENMNAMMETFPNAQPVFVRGAMVKTDVKVNAHPQLITTWDYVSRKSISYPYTN